MNLEPLRRALRAETEVESAERRADVTATCERIVAEAEAEARRLVRLGRLEGERAAEQEATRRRAAASRHAREITLAAQRRQLDALRAQARVAVLALRDDERYPRLLDRLADAARAQLGDDAAIVLDPQRSGGVIGRRDNASVDYTLPALAERVVDGLGEKLEQLWR